MAGTSGVVVSQANAATPSIGSIFDGKAFFLSQRVPSRSTYIDKIRANGGRHVKLEGQADYLIADHLRKDNPPNSVSYTFIDAAVRHSALPDPREHAAGPGKGTVRTIGSTAVAPKGTRTPFTAEDDRDLWNWVQGKLRAGEGTAKGNEIYKQLEAVNSRHTFQAWRDRYIKRLIDRPPAGVEGGEGVVQEQARDRAVSKKQPNGKGKKNGDELAPNHLEDGCRGGETPEQEDSDHASGRSIPLEMGPLETTKRTELANLDLLEPFEKLLENAQYIQAITIDQYDAAWAAWAEQESELTAEEWRELYEKETLPVYMERQKSDHLKEATRRHQEAHGARLQADQQKARSPVEEPQEGLTRGNSRSSKALSPGPQKRKRNTPTPRSKVYSSKRARQDNSDIFAREDEEDDEASRSVQRSASTVAQALRNASTKSTNAVVDLAEESAEEVCTQKRQLGSKTSNSLVEDVLTTSEANRAARAQLMTEARVEKTSPTSNVNRAAQTQLAVRAEEDDDPRSANSPSKPARWHTGLFADKQMEAGSHRTNQQRGSSVSGFSSASAQDANKGDALTEANLASQQQQHKAQLLRGVDLPEDDEEADQTAFANNLAALMGVKPKAIPQSDEPREADAVPNRLMDTPEEEGADAIEVGSDRGASEDEDEDETVLPGEGVDVDEAFTQNLDWPMSPRKRSDSERTRQQQQQQSFNVETQVQYPELPQHEHHQDSQPESEDDEGSSQPFGYPDLKAPGKPVWRDEDLAFSSQVGAKDAAEAEDPTTPTQPKIDSRVRDTNGPHEELVDVDQDGNEQDDNHDRAMDDEDYEVDLTVPPPEDGFSGDEEMEAEQVIVEPDVQRLKQTASQHQNYKGLTNEPVEISSQHTSDSSSLPEEVDEQDKKRRANTQALFDAETQEPDLEVPLPADSDEDEELELPSYTPIQIFESRPRFKVAAGLEESHPDNSLPQPFPPGGLFAKGSSKPSPTNAAIRSSTSHRQPLPPTKPSKRDFPLPSKTELKHERPSTFKASPIPARENESLDDFIARLTRASHPQSTIANALRMTSMRQPAAEMVVYLLKAGKPLPRGVKEVWTEEQDRVAVGGDSVAIRKLVEGADGRVGKGWDEFEQRVEFLGELGEG